MQNTNLTLLNLSHKIIILLIKNFKKVFIVLTSRFIHFFKSIKLIIKINIHIYIFIRQWTKEVFLLKKQFFYIGDYVREATDIIEGI